ncbi:STAS domain-containing protein [Bacillus kwashiorkori]|uniref:STAS domain-containing protein n=1 Tax=Bacillus kwashiorkori TaxID=1522318 RepID=UPI000781F8C7|nr:STAS domain-containing protein [Bacillus kwashiorkori]
MNITVDVYESGTLTTVMVKGEIDAYTSSQLRDVIFPIINNENINLEIDLADVSYMDSTGLGVFVAAFKKVKANGGTFSLTGLSNRLERLFVITGLSDIMDIKGETKGEAE